jgi:TetR/AcrR family transcriptional repressor of nem operon
MSRPREYDREVVLDKATNLFWEKGYEGTSMSELVAETGLNTRSLYNEFCCKEQLFLECIDHYGSKSIMVLSEILTKKPLGLSNIEAFFEYQIDNVTPENFKGCLLVNSLSEKETLTNQCNTKIESRISGIINLMYKCLKAEQDRKGIGDKEDCMALADYLLCFDCGLMNFGRNKTSKIEVRKIVDIALSVIKR